MRDRARSQWYFHSYYVAEQYQVRGRYVQSGGQRVAARRSLGFMSVRTVILIEQWLSVGHIIDYLACMFALPVLSEREWWSSKSTTIRREKLQE